MLFLRKRPRHLKEVVPIIDVTEKSESTLVGVTLSIHESPGNDERFGAALCMLGGEGSIDSTGSVVSIGKRPHFLTRDQFSELLHEAGDHGHLSDGFLEIEAVVDLNEGTVIWQPEDGEGVLLPHLDEVVENTIVSLVETNIFGDWFVPTAVVRSNAINNDA